MGKGLCDNSSKGAGARALKANPFTAPEYAPSGSAVVIENEADTTQGAGARTLTGGTAAPVRPY